MASEYKRMGEYIDQDQELRELLAKHHCKITGKRIEVIAGVSAFRVLAELKDRGYNFFLPGNLASAWGITRQAVNNLFVRGLLVTIEYSGLQSFDYKYVMFEPPEAQAKRRELQGAAAYFGVSDPEPVRDAAGWVQDSLVPVDEVNPAVPSGFEGLTEKEIAERDDICKEWVTCEYRSTCFDLAFNVDCICQKEDGPIDLEKQAADHAARERDRAELEAADREARAEMAETIDRITGKDQERKDQELRDLEAAGYKPGEIKILRGGFRLVRYDREKKEVWATLAFGSPLSGWYQEGFFPTYAAAERRLAEILTDDKAVQVNDNGRTLNSKDEAKLRAAGFSFYRNAGMDYGDKWGRIKIGPSWSTWGRYNSKEELAAAWSDLMKDEKALEG